jgi:putative membrane-bound dehydrogenase-like protein
MGTTDNHVLLPNAILLLASALLLGCGTGGDSTPDTTDTVDTEVSALQEHRIPATAPENVQETFRVVDDFEMQLLAAEPMVVDPVAVAYDENGVAYVAEMRDYPYADAETAEDWAEQTNQAPLGRIRVLEDTDGDGRFDESVVFADSLSWPTGIAVWQGGVYVTAAPHIWYLKDATGNHRADVRQKIYTGFRKYNIQATINNLRYGLDHKIYGAGSTNGGTVSTVGDPTAEPVKLSRNDFRFDPNSRAFERLSGAGRYGHTFDNEGNRFIASPYRPFMHAVVPFRYLERNSFIQIETALNDVTDVDDETRVYKESPPQPWRAIRAERRAASSSSSDPDRGFGHWTGASGSMLYRGDAYAEDYRENIFIGEVANNIVHRRMMSDDGVTFTSARADSGREFVASTDTWFRPVNATNAPDGTLHILDMYREFIEHPWSLPDDIHAQLDLTSGRDRGRIYRLAPPGFEAPNPPQLGSASTERLVSLLTHESSWWRTTAHRLIYERQDVSAVGPLREMLDTESVAVGRIRALWSLEGLDALQPRDIIRALNDPSPAVRQNAVRVAEREINASDRVLDAVLARANDPSIRVRYQAALTLGGLNNTQAVRGLANIAARDGESPWVRTAVLTARPELSHRLLADLLSRPASDLSTGHHELFQGLASVVGERNRRNELDNLLQTTDRLSDDRRAVRDAILQGLGSGLSSNDRTLLSAARTTGNQAETQIQQAVEESRELALDEGAPTPERTTAVHVLGYATSHHDWTDTFAPLLQPTQPIPVQEAALRVIGRSSSPRAVQLLLDQWENLTPTVRNQAVGVFMQTSDRVAALLDALETNRVSPSQISSTARSQLLEYSDSTLRHRAQDILTDAAQSPRSEVIAKYEKQLAPAEGDPARGEEIYRAQCSSCHTFQGMGSSLGPPLETVQDKNPEELLMQIFDPAREITPGYELYLLELDDGRTLQGTIANESPTGITLNQPGGVVRTVLRNNIESLSATGRSPMPEGLERALSPADVNDLLAFIREK